MERIETAIGNQGGKMKRDNSVCVKEMPRKMYTHRTLVIFNFPIFLSISFLFFHQGQKCPSPPRLPLLFNYMT